MTQAQIEKWWTDFKAKNTPPPPPPSSIEEVLASPDNPRLLLDPEFEELFQKTLAQVGWPRTRDEQEWRTHLFRTYRGYLVAYYEQGWVIPFVAATDGELQEWAKHARYRYDDEVRTLHESLRRNAPTGGPLLNLLSARLVVDHQL